MIINDCLLRYTLHNSLVHTRTIKNEYSIVAA